MSADDVSDGAPGVLQAAARAQMPFIANEGQIANADVRYFARTFGGTVYVGADGGLTYAIPRFEADSGATASGSKHRARRLAGTAVFREILRDARAAAPEGAEPSDTAVSWFLGSDPARWRSQARAFQTVNLGEVYAGITLAVRAHANNVEKIFTVRPGADPALIRLAVEGVARVTVTSEGELEVATAHGPVRFSAPVAYQEIEGRRVAVPVAYACAGAEVSFALGAYDRAQALVIDPLIAATFVGGGNDDMIWDMVRDYSGNVFVGGATVSATGFPMTNGYDTGFNGGAADGFILKFNGKLETLKASTFFGGSQADMIYALQFNPYNNSIYAAGYTESSDLPAVGGFDTSYNGNRDGFVAKFNSTLTSLSSASFLGGANIDVINDLAFTTNSDVFVTGYTASPNFPTNNTYSSNSYLSVYQGSNDIFVTRINSALSTLLASTYLGGIDDDTAYAIAVDTNMFAYIAGYTLSTNITLTNAAGAIPDSSFNGAKDVFVARFAPALTNRTLVGSTYLGAASDEVAYDIGLDEFRTNVYIVGYSESANYPQSPVNNEFAPGYTNMYMGGKDVFVTRLSGRLTNIIQSTYLGGSGDDIASAVLVDAGWNPKIYVTGYTVSPNFPITRNGYDIVTNGETDAFLARFLNNLTNMQAGTYLGGSGDDIATALAPNQDASAIFVAGYTESGNFPMMPSAYDQFPSGGYNGFVSKLGAGMSYGTVKWSVTLPDTFGPYAGTPTFAADGTIYIGDDYGNLYAITEDGDLLWTCPASAANADMYEAAPAVGSNGVIYACSEQDRNLYAIGTNGSVNWTYTMTGAPLKSPAIGLDGTIYVSAFDQFMMYAFNPNGTVKWTSNFRWPADSAGLSPVASPVVGTNGAIYATVSSSGNYTSLLYCLTANAATNWIAYLDSLSRPTPAIGSNGTLYVHSGGRLYSVANNGAINWSNNLGGTAGGGSSDSSPVIGSNGVIYIGVDSNKLFSINPDGTTNWARYLGGAMKGSAAIAADGTIYVGANGGTNFAFNPDGTTNWFLDTTEAANYASPLIGGDGTVYFANGDKLYAVFGRERMGNTVWPTLHHDLSRSRNAGASWGAPLPPTEVTASIDLSDRILVTWLRSTNATLYEVWRSLSNSVSSAVYLGASSRTNYTDGYVVTGFNYYYWIKAKNLMGVSDFSSPAALGGVPTLPPTFVVATDGYPTNLYYSKVGIVWDACSGARGYEIRRSLSNATNTSAILANTTATNYDDLSPSPGLTYYYWVRSYNLTTTSGYSMVDSGGIAPAAPADLVAGQGVSSSMIAVTWSASPGATVYELYRHTTNDLALAALWSSQAGVAYNDADATPFRDYYYWVRATNQYGVSPIGAGVSGYRCLAPPLALSASDGTYSNKIRVSWQIESTNASSYLVYRGTGTNPLAATQRGEVLFSSADLSGSTNYDDLEIDRGTLYYYWVKAQNAYGVSVFSSGDSGGTAPLAATGVTAGDGLSSNLVTVTWAAASGASGYEVYRAPYADVGYATLVGVAATTTYDDPTVEPGLRYYFWVRATNAFGRSAFSGFDSGYRLLLPPTTLAAADGVSTASLWVTWATATNVTSYEVWRGSETNVSSAARLSSYVTTNAYDDTASTPGAYYYYWVKAKNASFSSGFSPYDGGYRALGEADLAVTNVIVLPTMQTAGRPPNVVSFAVVNNGPNPLAAPNYWVRCDFYLSANATFGDADDLWFGSNTLGVTVAVGGSTSVTLSDTQRQAVTMPHTAAGSYYLFVRIQHVYPSGWLDARVGNNVSGRAAGPVRIGDTVPMPSIANDFNGDGQAELTVYRQADGLWYTRSLDGTVVTLGQAWGGMGYQPVIGDFDGDNRADFAVYHEAAGLWYIRSATGAVLIYGAVWGAPGYRPVPADYDGDRKTDVAVYHETSGLWYIVSLSGTVIAWGTAWGGSGWTPTAGDYNGDGAADLAVYQAGVYNWYIADVNGMVLLWEGAWGQQAGFTPVPGDYDGDGVSDLALYHEASGYWFIASLAKLEVLAWGVSWGAAGYVPVPGDYDADGISDLAVYGETSGLWYIRTLSGTPLAWGTAWGGVGYIPVAP